MEPIAKMVIGHFINYKLIKNFYILNYIILVYYAVEGLAILQSKFSVLKEWTGDPCLPSTFTWDWVNCSSDPVPRVTALYVIIYYI